MATSLRMATPMRRTPMRDDDLLLRETHHRAANDLQLVVGLLGLQSRRAASEETRAALRDAMERVAVLAQARSALDHQRHPSLELALRQICDALHAQAEPRAILISMQVEQEVHGLPLTRITSLALVVNELATNAIKHAFREGRVGHIRITIGGNAGRDLIVTVDDDGLPFPHEALASRDGMGLGLTKRLMASIGGLLIPPPPGSKMFELRVPLGTD